MVDDGSGVPECVDLGPPAHGAIQVSVILPCFNEESNVAPEVERICRHLDDSGYVYEVIVIDDGSTDGTWDEVQEQASLWPAVRPVRFAVNGGPGTAPRGGAGGGPGGFSSWRPAPHCPTQREGGGVLGGPGEAPPPRKKGGGAGPLK